MWKMKLARHHIICVILLTTLTLSIFFTSAEPFDTIVDVVIIFNGKPLATITREMNISLSNPIIQNISKQKEHELLSAVSKLQSKGYPVEVEEYLQTVVLGVIAKIPSRYIPIISNDKKVELCEKSNTYKVNLENSVKMINSDKVWNLQDINGNNVTGNGIEVAVVDTGVNYLLPALGGGIGPNFKVVGGYDFIDKDKDPMDDEGHGTAVAVIISGKDEKLKGVAPDSRILAYRALSEFQETSTSLIVQAIDRAVADGADIINLSFGGLGENKAVGTAIANAVNAGVIVVAAAGNSGPETYTIEYPSALNNVISVGASSNIGSQSYKAEFSIPELELSFDAIPLNKTVQTKEPLEGKLVYVGLASKEEVLGLDLNGAIAVAKRGVYFFSDKAKNVQEKGAIALIVFNNQSYNFIGALKDEVSIPVASIPGSEGEFIVETLKSRQLNGRLSITPDPYQVVWFSSRGPASPFYIKPNLLAPGNDVTTIDYRGRYVQLSGTSFSSPHVAGAVALIKQVHPELTPYEVMSLLMGNAEPLMTGGQPYTIDTQGAGLMDVYNSIMSDFLVMPNSLVIHLSPLNQTKIQRNITVLPLTENNITLNVSDTWTGPDYVNVRLKDKRSINGTTQLTIEAELKSEVYGTFYGWINISSNKVTQRVLIRVNVNRVGITIVEHTKDHITFTFQPKDFIAARITIQTPGETIQITHFVTSQENITFETPMLGEYWVSVLANTKTGILVGYDIIAIGQSYEQPIPITTSTSIPTPSIASIPYNALETIAYTLILIIFGIILYSTLKVEHKGAWKG
ncbi:MAG: S8 family serine peptidase [Nitrososphaeria archaeon]